MKLKQIFEAPYLNDEELPFTVIAKISKEALVRSYEKLVDIGEDISIFKKQNGPGFIAGKVIDGHLSTFVTISARENIYPGAPTQLSKFQQVSMVNISKEMSEQGITKSVYNSIAQHFDLISDHEQFLGAKGLWKSLARESSINVFIFDCSKNDYFRDSINSVPLKYNGKNIDTNEIWGTSFNHKGILLVATTKELK